MQRFANHDAGVRHHGVQPVKSAHERLDCDRGVLSIEGDVHDAEKPLRRARGSIVLVASTRALMSEPDTEILLRQQRRPFGADPCARGQLGARCAGELR